jgi:hypothetical protein
MTRSIPFLVLGALLGGGCDAPGGIDTDPGATDPTGEPPSGMHEESCRLACEASEPAAADPGPCGDPDTVQDCVNRCVVATHEMDDGCASCVIEHLEWEPPWYSCGPDDCYCEGGTAIFWDPEKGVCGEACTDYLDEKKKAREDAPVPAPIGHLPDRALELPDDHDITAGAVSDDGTRLGVIGPVGDGLPYDAFWVTTSQLDLVESWPIPTRCGALWGRRDGGWTVGCNPTADRVGLVSVDPGGATLWERWFGAKGIYAHGVGTRFLDGSLFVYEGALTFVDPGGQPRGSAALAASRDLDARDGRLAAVDVLHNEDFVVSAHAIQTPSPDEVELTPLWSRVFEDEFPTKFKPLVVEQLPDGSTAVGGFAGVERGCCSYGEPWVAVYDPAGDLSWEWRYETEVIAGVVVDIDVSPSGELVVATDEDPLEAEYTGDEDTGCTIYGCEGLGVHYFDPDGTQRWSYQHRQAYSWPKSIGFLPDGDVVVFGTLRREAVHGLIMRFAP